MKTKSGRELGCALLFLTPFFICGVVTTVMIAKHVMDSVVASRWVSGEAQIQQAQAREVSDGDSSSWTLTVKYRYVYEGQTYTGTRAGLDDDVGFGMVLRKRAAILGEARSHRQTVPCRINPRAPEEALLFTGTQWDHIFFLSIFSIVFGGVGGGGYIVVLWARRRVKEDEALQELHPGAPWMWKPEWERGVIPSSAKGGMIGLWAFGIIWSLISAPVLFAVPEEVRAGNTLALIGYIFPVVGVVILAMAVRATIVFLKWGRADFVMRSVPGVIGGPLVGAVRVPQAVSFDDEPKLTLTCTKTVTSGSGKNRSTSKRILWTEEQQVSLDRLQVGAQTLIPVHFTIPYSCRETDDDADIDWSLGARGATPGPDFLANFAVPVFKTPDSDPTLSEKAAADALISEADLDEAAQGSRIHLRELGDGRLELDVPPSVVRTPGMFVGTLIFTLFWTGAIVLMLKLGAPIFMAVIFGLFDVVMIGIVLQYLTGRRRTRVDAAGLHLEKRFLAFWSRKQVGADAIARVETPKTSQSQAGSKVTVYYSVRVFYRDVGRERHVDVATMINSKAEARWIADRVENAVLQS